MEDDSPILLFDGVCNLCHSFVQFVFNQDSSGKIRFAPLSSRAGKEVLEEYNLNSSELDSVVLLYNESTYIQSEAVGKVFSIMAGYWKIPGFMVRITPKFLGDLFYNLVASNRYRIFGRKDRCQLPGEEFEERLVDGAREF